MTVYISLAPTDCSSPISSRGFEVSLGATVGGGSHHRHQNQTAFPLPLSRGRLGRSRYWEFSTSRGFFSRFPLQRTIHQLCPVLHLHDVQRHVLEVDLDVDVDEDVGARNNQLDNLYPSQYHHQLNPFQPSVDRPLSDRTPTRPMYTSLVHPYQLSDTQTQGISPHLSPSSPYSLLHRDHEHTLNSTGPLFQVQTHRYLDPRLRHHLRQLPYMLLLLQCCLLDQLFANRLVDLQRVSRLQAAQAIS